MEGIRNRMMEIEDPRHPSYVKYALADILIIIMIGVLCGLDTLEDLVVYAKSAADFLRETFGIENIPSKATFGRVLSAVDGREVGEAILDILRERFGTSGEVIAEACLQSNGSWKITDIAARKRAITFPAGLLPRAN